MSMRRFKITYRSGHNELWVLEKKEYDLITEGLQAGATFVTFPDSGGCINIEGIRSIVDDRRQRERNERLTTDEQRDFEKRRRAKEASAADGLLRDEIRRDRLAATSDG